MYVSLSSKVRPSAARGSENPRTTERDSFDRLMMELYALTIPLSEAERVTRERIRWTARSMPKLFPLFALLGCLACQSTPLAVSVPSEVTLSDAQIELCQKTPLFEGDPPIQSYWGPGTFPDQPEEFTGNWYSAELCAMGEAPMARPSGPSSLRFRFLWIRSFDPAISVRIDHDGQRTKLVAVQLESPREDYQPGAVTRRESRELSPQEWQAFSEAITQSRVWEAESDSHTCCDGAQWIFEIADPNRNHIVDKLSGADLRALGEAALALSGLEPENIY